MSVIYSGTSNNYRVRGCNNQRWYRRVIRRVINLRTSPSCASCDHRFRHFVIFSRFPKFLIISFENIESISRLSRPPLPRRLNNDITHDKNCIRRETFASKNVIHHVSIKWRKFFTISITCYASVRDSIWSWLISFLIVYDDHAQKKTTRCIFNKFKGRFRITQRVSNPSRFLFPVPSSMLFFFLNR